ncbi:hypothetical protein F5Y16DRAFT_408896 [Xylariaceae sp. FL0255]|nr:hypothetical protein F5Y16DRAFT_408896 [Xylariaceae sp. FL0255]
MQPQYRQDDVQPAEEGFPSTTSNKSASAPSETPHWLPYTLRATSLSMILANSGITNDDASKAIVLGSTSVPTLLAVVAGLLAGILLRLDDVARTEQLARMGTPFGASARRSLTWFEFPFHFFPGYFSQINWALPCAGLIVVLGALAVSPLSSTLLDSQFVVFDKQTPFHQLELSTPIQPSPLATTYFRTISNILQNVSTTAWITDDGVIVPSWPGNSTAVPLSPTLSDETETWSANATVFSADLEGESMSFKMSRSPIKHSTNSANISVTLESDSGCEVDFDFGNYSYFVLLEIWSSLKGAAIQLGSFDGLAVIAGNFNYKIRGCSDGDEMFIPSTSSGDGSTLSNLSPPALACQNTHHHGSPTVSASSGQGESTVAVNESQYLSTRSALDPTMMNTTAFDNVFYNTNWTTHLDASKIFGDNYTTTGPANLLATASLNYNTPTVNSNSSLIGNMQRIRRQFFAELLHNVFETMDAAQALNVYGAVITTTRRIVVVPGVAIALEILILMQAVLLAIVLYTTQPSRRPLNTIEDPATIFNIAKLMANNPSTINAFMEASDGTSRNLEQVLSKYRFHLAEDQIETIGLDPLINSSDAAALSKLYALSHSRALYETLLVYDINVSISGRDLGTVNPALLITTFIGVAMPYLALAKSPVPGYKGFAISLRSSYYIWSIFVSLGAFLTQILTITMSSLWTRAPGAYTQSMNLSQKLELRTVPLIGTGDIPSSPDSPSPEITFIKTFFSDLSTSWIYGALNQLSLDGSDLARSKDSWNFVPNSLDVSTLHSVQNTGNVTELAALSVNVTMETPAIRARLECSPYTRYELGVYVEDQVLPGSFNLSINETTSFLVNSRRLPANFPVKWIRGQPLQVLRAGAYPGDTAESLIWAEAPQMTALNCQPVIEAVNSSVTVDAFNDGYPWLEYKADFNAYDDDYWYVNITASHGVLFLAGLLGAADIDNFGGNAEDVDPTRDIEELQEQTFNFREPGLNVDFMTYAMLSLVNFDYDSLQNATILEQTAQTTFSTMYQHFVNHNLSLIDGGYAYQQVGATLPYIGQRNPDQYSKRSTNATNSSNPVTTLSVSMPVDVSILAYLIITCGVLAIASRRYNRLRYGPVDNIADTAVLVASSERFLELAKYFTARSAKIDDSLLAKLGWFEDADGRRRWGVELVNAEEVIT